MRETPYISAICSRFCGAFPCVACACCLVVTGGRVAGALEPECAPDALPPVIVAAVIDAQTLRLDSGESVRLAGALAPQPPGWWKEPRPWPAAVAAREEVERIVLGKRVALRFAPGEARRDRHERYLAQVLVKDGERSLWLQAHLVGAGHARAYSLSGRRACARALQKEETAAREQKAGLWRGRGYKVWDSTDTDALLKRVGSFQAVEGTVDSVGRTRKWTFLNFTSDWRTDFTVAVEARYRRAFEGSDIDLPMLEGRRVRVRGWLERWNGPVVKATHPEQIEMIE